MEDPKIDTPKFVEAQKNYFNTDKGKAAISKYASSEKGKEVKKKYSKTDKGKQAMLRYRKSEKYKQARERRKAQSKLITKYLHWTENNSGSNLSSFLNQLSESEKTTWGELILGGINTKYDA